MMATKSNIISWTLEYACRFKYHNVISAISKKTSTNIEDLSVPKLYLVTSALHSIISSQDFDNYEGSLSYLQYLYDNCKDFIPFRIYSKLSTGIKMVILLKMLEENKDGILTKLNELFPRSGASYDDVDKKELQRLTSVYSNFRKFYLPLSANPFHCQEYLRDEYHDEYGPEFHSALTKLTEKFLSNIECHLPPTTLEKFMKCTEDQCYELHEDSPTPTFEIFLDVILGKSKLSEAELMQLLTMLGTISESERVQPLDLYTSSERSSSGRDHDGSKSLFSSSSNSEQNKIISKTNVHMLVGKSNSSSSNEIFDSHRRYTNIVASNTDSDIYDSHETYVHGPSNVNVNKSKHAYIQKTNSDKRYDNRTIEGLSKKYVRNLHSNLHDDQFPDTCHQSETLDMDWEMQQQRRVIKDCQVKLLQLSPKLLQHRTRQMSCNSGQGQEKSPKLLRTRTKQDTSKCGQDEKDSPKLLQSRTIRGPKCGQKKDSPKLLQNRTTRGPKCGQDEKDSPKSLHSQTKQGPKCGQDEKDSPKSLQSQTKQGPKCRQDEKVTPKLLQSQTRTTSLNTRQGQKVSPKSLQTNAVTASSKSGLSQKVRKSPMMLLRLRSSLSENKAIKTSERRAVDRGIKTSLRRTVDRAIKTSERRTVDRAIKTLRTTHRGIKLSVERTANGRIKTFDRSMANKGIKALKGIRTHRGIKTLNRRKTHGGIKQFDRKTINKAERITHKGIKGSKGISTYGGVKELERNEKIKNSARKIGNNGIACQNSNTLVKYIDDVHTSIAYDKKHKKSRGSVSKGQTVLVSNTPTSDESVHKEVRINTEPGTSTIVESTYIRSPAKRSSPGYVKKKNKSGEPEQVYYISSSSNDNTSQGGTCIEISDSDNKIEVFSEDTSESRSSNNSSKIDIFDSGSDDSNDEDDLHDFVPTSDLDELDLDDIFNYHLKVLPSKTQVPVPHIASHARHPDLKLCIIKLYRNKSLDIKEKGIHYAVYS